MPKPPAEEPEIELGEPKNIGLPANLCMVNRGAELVEISERFDQADTRLVCLHGIGGIGKSHLAIEAVHRNAWRFPDGILWLKVDGPEFQLADICRNIAYLLDLGLEEMSEEGILALPQSCAGRPQSSAPAVSPRTPPRAPFSTMSEEQLRHKALDAISARRCLIILDNAENIPPDERRRIAGFLGGFDPRRGSKALVTSRAVIAEFEQLDGATPLRPVGQFDDVHAEELLREEATRRDLWTQIKDKVNEFLRHGRGHPFLLSRSGANFSVQELKRAFGVDDEIQSLRNLLTEELPIEGREEQLQLAGDYCWALCIYIYWRRSEDGLRWSLAGALAFRAQGDKKRLATTYGNIGSIHYAQGSYDEALEEALELCRKGLNILERIGDNFGLAAIYHSIAGIHYAKGSYDEALGWYKKSVDIKEQIGDRAGLATTLHNMGYLEMERGRLQKALEYFTHSRDLYKQIGQEKYAAEEESVIAEIRRKIH